MRAEYLLISDVDDTLLGDEDALEKFRSWFDAHPHLLCIAYNSGRFVDSILGSMKSTRLPTPRAVVGGIGTEIRLWPEGDALDSWPVPPSQGWKPERIRAALSGVPNLRLQPPETQSPLKVSYFLEDATPEDLHHLRDRLAHFEIEADFIYSANLDLDWLPVGINKGSAARHLAEHLGYDANHVFVAGNSANDTHLFQQGYRGVVVGNADPDLKTVSGSSAYLARAGHAAGVLEGLARWLVHDGRLDPL